MHSACMATKTISIDLEAYERLCRARTSQRESFSRVIHRARWDSAAKTCGTLLESLKTMTPASEAVIARLDAAQREDSPPDDPWSPGGN